MPIAPPVYCNKVDELVPFASQLAAENWLKENTLDISGTPLLVPFKDENDQIKFLKPGVANGLHSAETEAANDKFRIMGAANYIKKGMLSIFTRWIGKDFAPHLNDLKDNTISLADHGFIVIYERGDKPAGKEFAKLFRKEEEDLFSQIKITSTNGVPHLNEAKFIQDLSQLSIDLEIRVGMSYFVTKGDSGKAHIYRHIFKEDPVNEKIAIYFKKEEERHTSLHVTVRNNKSKKYHLGGFLIDWCTWIVFAAITAIGAGLILGIFIVPPIGTIAAGLVAVVTFIGASSYGFHRADKNNPTTIEFGTPEFVVESDATFSSRIKQRFKSLYDLIFTKSNKIVALSTENNEPEISTAPIGIFTTIVSSTSNIPVCHPNSMPFISELVNSSLKLFTFQQENVFIQDSMKSSSPALRN